VESLSDEQLLARVMAGDRAALAPLVERHHGPLVGYLYRMNGGNRSSAEDLVQETFVRLLEQKSYQAGRPFKPWLYAIATNLARDQGRSPSAWRTTSLEHEALPEFHDTAPGPEERALAAEQGRLVAAALERLSAEYRAAVLLRFYGGLTLQEIAEALGIPLGTVKSRLSTGTRQLQHLLRSVKEGMG
jgi:RNA polymerase sigma-70 factor (ECF subfamily)